MTTTTQVSVAGPAVAAIVNPELPIITIVILGLIAVVSIIVENVTKCKLKHVSKEEPSKTE